VKSRLLYCVITCGVYPLPQTPLTLHFTARPTSPPRLLDPVSFVKAPIALSKDIQTPPEGSASDLLVCHSPRPSSVDPPRSTFLFFLRLRMLLRSASPDGPPQFDRLNFSSPLSLPKVRQHRLAHYSKIDHTRRPLFIFMSPVPVNTYSLLGLFVYLVSSLQQRFNASLPLISCHICLNFCRRPPSPLSKGLLVRAKQNP